MSLYINIMFMLVGSVVSWASKKKQTEYMVLNFATPLRRSVRMTLTLPKWGLESPSGLLKIQNSIARVKTPRLEVFFISLERS